MTYIYKGQCEIDVRPDGLTRFPVHMWTRTHYIRRYVLVQGENRCIHMYPLRAWETLRREEEPAAAGAEPFEVEVRPDRTFALPSPLRRYAGIDASALCLGALDHVELWDSDVFEAYLNSGENRIRKKKGRSAVRSERRVAGESVRYLEMQGRVMVHGSRAV